MKALGNCKSTIWVVPRQASFAEQTCHTGCDAKSWRRLFMSQQLKNKVNKISMFTMFHGFHLVEEYHQWKKDHRKSRNPIGGNAICSSVAMVLHISTPTPSALADATGLIKQKYMVRTGLIIGLIGLLLGYIVLIICGSNRIF